MLTLKKIVLVLFACTTNKTLKMNTIKTLNNTLYYESIVEKKGLVPAA